MRLTSVPAARVAARVSAPVRPTLLAQSARRGPAAAEAPSAGSEGSGRRRSWWRRGGSGLPADPWAAALAVLDASPDAVIGIDAEGTTVFANAAAAVLLVRPLRDLVGRPSAMLVPDLPGALVEVRRRTLGGVPTDPTGDGLDLVAMAPTGDEIPVTAWTTPFAGPDGRFLLAVTLRDQRPQHDLDDLCLRLDEEARSARAVVRAVLKAVTDRVVVIADADGRITDVNRAAEKVLGYRAEELVGRPTTRLSDPGDLADVAHELGVPAGIDPLLELARWGLPNRQDWDYVTRDGLRRPVSLSVTAIGDREAPQGFVCVASDRTVEWQQVAPRRPQNGERLLLDLDDAATRVLRWGVGRGGRPGS